MSPTAAFEFLLVSTNYQTVTAITRGAKQFGCNLGFVPRSESAREYIGRRKVDGVFVDMDLSGAQELIRFIRDGASNRNTVVFACVPKATEFPITVVTGANFLLHKPLSEESVVSYMNAARDIIAREQRCYFRHPVSIPVFLTVNGKEQRAMMTDVSEGGMAVRLLRPVEHRSVVDFAFELSPGVTIHGKGLVAWTNSQGMIGIKFQLLRDNGPDLLHAWINQQEDVSSLPPAQVIQEAETK